MEQPCYKCGVAVEEGTPFCPHCSAPQIRVMVAEPAQAPADLSSISINAQGEATLPASQTVPVLALPMQWSGTVRPCALAALVASLLMVLGLYPFVAMVAVGFMAVLFFRQRVPGTAIKTGAAAGIGAISGLLWFGLSAVLETSLTIFLHKGPELRSELLSRIDQAASQTTDPQVLAMFDRIKSPGGLEIMIVCAFLFALVAAVALASAGGMLAGALLGRRPKS
jgi:hypothetical protein